MGGSAVQSTGHGRPDTARRAAHGAGNGIAQPCTASSLPGHPRRGKANDDSNVRMTDQFWAIHPSGEVQNVSMREPTPETEVVGPGGGEVPRIGEGEFLGGFIPVGENVRKMFVLMRGPTPESGRKLKKCCGR
jgi:hypothetical protein